MRAGKTGKSHDDADVWTLWLRVYQTFVEAVDAVDNGINMFDTKTAPRYEQNTTLSSRVGFLNPSWNVPYSNEDLDRLFGDAVALTGAEFEAAVANAEKSWLPARALVAAALGQAEQVHASGVCATCVTFTVASSCSGH
jgi:uncharacterized UPF0160 family protein